MNKYEIYYEQNAKMHIKQIMAFDVREAVTIFRQLAGKVFIRGVHKMKGNV